MIRLDDNTIAISNEEAVEMYEMLRHFMERAWDHHTNIFISTRSVEEGMEYLTPDAYKLANELSAI